MWLFLFRDVSDVSPKKVNRLTSFDKDKLTSFDKDSSSSRLTSVSEVAQQPPTAGTLYSHRYAEPFGGAAQRDAATCPACSGGLCESGSDASSAICPVCHKQPGCATSSRSPSPRLLLHQEAVRQNHKESESVDMRSAEGRLRGQFLPFSSKLDGADVANKTGEVGGAVGWPLQRGGRQGDGSEQGQLGSIGQSCGESGVTKQATDGVPMSSPFSDVRFLHHPASDSQARSGSGVTRQTEQAPAPGGRGQGSKHEEADVDSYGARHSGTPWENQTPRQPARRAVGQLRAAGGPSRGQQGRGGRGVGGKQEGEERGRRGVQVTI